MCQMIASVCILAVGFLTVALFVPEAEGHPYEVWYHYHYYHCAEWDGMYHTYCGGRLVITLRSWAPPGHPNLSDPNHIAHGQSTRPDVNTSSLERGTSCSQCTYS